MDKSSLVEKVTSTQAVPIDLALGGAAGTVAKTLRAQIEGLMVPCCKGIADCGLLLEERGVRCIGEGNSTTRAGRLPTPALGPFKTFLASFFGADFAAAGSLCSACLWYNGEGHRFVEVGGKAQGRHGALGLGALGRVVAEQCFHQLLRACRGVPEAEPKACARDDHSRVVARCCELLLQAVAKRVIRDADLNEADHVWCFMETAEKTAEALAVLERLVSCLPQQAAVAIYAMRAIEAVVGKALIQLTRRSSHVLAAGHTLLILRQHVKVMLGQTGDTSLIRATRLMEKKAVEEESVPAMLLEARFRQRAQRKVKALGAAAARGRTPRPAGSRRP